MRIRIELVSAAILGSVSQAHVAGHEVSRPVKPTELRIAVDQAGSVLINGTRIEKPGCRAALQAAFANPSREESNSIRVSHVWDELGVAAGMRRDAKFYASVQLSFGGEDANPVTPRIPYRGGLAVGRSQIGPQTTMDQLQEAGFQPESEFGGELLAELPDAILKMLVEETTHQSLSRSFAGTKITTAFDKKSKRLTSVSIDFPWSEDPPRGELQTFVVDGGTEQLRAALETGADANARDTLGRSLLHLAAIHGTAPPSRCRGLAHLSKAVIARTGRLKPRMNTDGRLATTFNRRWVRRCNAEVACPLSSPLRNRPQNTLLVESSGRTIRRMPMEWEERITVTPGIRGGKPCIKGTRITVSDVLEYLAGGMSEKEILDDFPSLTVADVRACLGFAAARERRLAG